MKRNTDSKDATVAMQIEALRQSQLQRKDLDLSNEYDAAVYALWYLLNPTDVAHRDSIGTADVCEHLLPKKKTKALHFTVHAHHGQPLKESADDTLIYIRLSRFSRAFLHFITDRFKIHRIR